MEPLTAFAPRRLLEFRLFEPGSSVVQDATVLFVDLAGFTPLTDRLGAIGSRGTEHLSQLLRAFFAAASDTVMDRGGDPIAYGGDALTILFDGPPAEAMQAASSSAAEIQRLAEETAGTETPVGDVSLRTKVGIARGSVTSATAGSSRRSIPVHLGPGLDLAVEAESRAQAGEISVHASARPSTHRRTTIERPVLIRRGQLPADESAVLARLVDPVVLGRLAQGRALLESHRSISVAFVRFPPVAANELSSFLGLVGALLEIVDGAGGEVVQVAGGDKGMVAMVVFGAPVAHSDDPLRAVQTMLDLRRLERRAAIGIATGPVFAAMLGSDRRRFSAHSGQAVNIAARLMQAAAPGQLLTEPVTWRGSHQHLRQDGPIVLRALKGRKEPVESRAVAGWRRGRRRPEGSGDLPLVGRQQELVRIEQFLDEVTSDGGTMLTLIGEPGIGKSRLVREAVQRATIRGVRPVFVDAEGHPRGRPSGLWRELVGDLTDTPLRASSKVWLTGLTALLPGAKAQLGVLGKLIGLRLGAGTANPLPPQLEAELARDLVAQVVRAAAKTYPVLVVIENVHRLDSTSRELVENVARALPGSSAGLLATSRTGASAEHMGVGQSLRLAGLTDPEVAQLAADTWQQSGQGTPPAWLATAAGRRAGGNPLFVRIVTRLLREQWQPGDPPPSGAFAAESLSSLISERVDQLPPQASRVLGVLAIAHRPCTDEEAAAFLSDEVDAQAVSTIASQLESENFVRTDTDGTQVRIRLQHELLQRVVYESLSHQERDRLHRRIATYLAELDADPIEVAEHVDRLNDPVLGRRWFPLAADSALASWDFAGAAGWWQRAAPLLSGPARASAQVQYLEALLIAGKANEVLSAADDVGSKQHGRPSSAMLGPDLQARFAHAVAEAAFISGDLDRSESAASEAMRLTDPVDEPRHQRAAELLVLGQCARGRFQQAILLAEQHLERAQRVADTRAQATAHAALGAALLLAGKASAAVVHYEQALAGAVAVDDVVVQIHVRSDLAGCFFQMGRYADCAKLLAEARASADVIGYRRHLAFNLSNEAQLRAAVGDAYATSCAAAAVRRSLEMGDLIATANALHTWVVARPATAADPDLWRRLRGIDDDLGRLSVAAEDTADLAVASARRARTAEALTWAAEATSKGQQCELPSVLRRATFARLLADARSRPADQVDRDAVLADLKSLTQAEDLSEVEHAEIAVEQWRLTRTAADRDTAAALLRTAYAAEPSAQVRHWFSLIEEPPPPPPPALPPPVGIGRHRPTRSDLMGAFDRLEAAIHRHGD